MSIYRGVALGLASLSFSAAAVAHTGEGAVHGFSAGLAHPFLGLDHIAAAMATGLWAARMGWRSQWAISGVFLAALAAGALAGFQHTGAETSGIILAVPILILGLLAAFDFRAPGAAASTIVAIFAACHGYAHGAEVPAGAGVLEYSVGFIAATTALLALGAGLGRIALSDPGMRGFRAAGFAFAVIGACLSFS